MDYKEAKECLVNLELDKCEDFFKENNYQLEYGYCELLRGNVNEARKIFTPIKDLDLRADWAYLLIQFMNNYIQSRNPMSIIKTIAKDSKASDKEFIINYCEKHKNDNSKNQSEGDVGE